MIVAVVAVVMCIGISVRFSEAAAVRHVPGEITWIDTKLGTLQLKSDTSPGKGEIKEYRITEHETRVTNRQDKKFLLIGDLRPGQHVILDVVKGEEDGIVQKITADPRRMAGLREAYGEVEAIDAAG
jgi:hypothetical protein